MKNLFKKTGNIVVSLGDEGAIITCFLGDRLESRMFTASPFSNEVADFFKGKSSYKITLLLDTIDQNFVFSSLPHVGSKNLNKIIQRKLNTEFDKNDFNSYMPLGKEDGKARKDLRYVFISVRNSPPVSEWLDFFSSLPNLFSGIYLIPIEAETFFEKIRAIQKISKKSNDDWDILISQNRVGGFRQIVFRNGKLAFTRISQSISMQSPDSVGVNISQEALNTLEYIRRIGYSDQPISIYIVSSKDSFPYIDINAINKQDIYHLSPYEVSKALTIKNSALENDKFGDVVFSSNFINSKKILKLDTTESKLVKNFLLLKNTVNLLLSSLIITLPLYSVYLFYLAYDNSSKIEQINADMRVVQSKVANVKDFEKEYNINPEFLESTLRFDESINAIEIKDYMEVIKKFQKIAKDKFSITSFNIKNEAETNSFQILFRGLIEYDKSDVSDIFFKAREFHNLVNKEFNGLQIDISNMPSENNLKLGSGGEQKADPIINITISGSKGILTTAPVTPNIAPQ